MNKTTLTLFFVLLLAACGNSDTQKQLSTSDIEITEERLTEPKFKFKETSWDFGTIKEGDVVKHTFHFTNVGDDDLVITDVTTTCGCTAPSWPREKIAPGEEGKIKVEFDSNHKSGTQNKQITVYANTVPVTTKLSISSFVTK